MATSKAAVAAPAARSPVPTVAQSAPPCQFILGFASLDARIPNIVGPCLDNQTFAANGDATQQTTGGELVWRKLDNWTAFTDGYHTWINGPSGVQERLNTQRFAWEANPEGLPVVSARSAAATPSATAAAPVTFGDGTYIVGQDIQPGTYRTRTGSAGCYWARLSGYSGAFTDVIADNNSDAPNIVTVLLTDAGFQSTGCGTWTSDLSPITSSPTAPFSDGTYFVGRDIAPGTWRAPGGQGCYWARLSNFANSPNSTIASDTPAGAAIVTIASSDTGFQTVNCGTWTASAPS